MAIKHLSGLYRNVSKWCESSKSTERCKSWEQDRLCLLSIFERARHIVAVCQLGTVERANFHAFVEQYETLGSIEELDKAIQVDKRHCDDSGSEPARNIPARLLVAFFFMAFTTVTTGVCALMMEQKFPVFKTVSSVADYLITVWLYALCLLFLTNSFSTFQYIFTTAAFVVVLIFWCQSARYKRFINLVLRNVIELPAIYCQPVSSEKIFGMSPQVETLCKDSPLDSEYSFRTFTVQPIKHRAWGRTRNNHIYCILLLTMHTAFSAFHLAIGSYRMLKEHESFGLATCLFIAGNYCLQALFFCLYPLINYSYCSFCVVLTIQSELLNQVGSFN